MRQRRFRKALKRRLFKAAQGCQACGGGSLSGSRHVAILEIHHHLPRSQDGEETPENAVLLCRDCHVLVHQDELVSPLPILGANL